MVNDVTYVVKILGGRKSKSQYFNNLLPALAENEMGGRMKRNQESDEEDEVGREGIEIRVDEGVREENKIEENEIEVFDDSEEGQEEVPGEIIMGRGARDRWMPER